MTTKHLKMLESEENMEDKSKKSFNAIENALAGPAGLGFAIAKPSVPPRSKYREQAPDICSLRRPVEPTVLILPIANQTKLKAPRRVFSLAEVCLMTSEAIKMPLLGAFS